MSEYNKLNSNSEFLRINSDGSFKLADGQDPLRVIGALAQEFIKQNDKIKKLEREVDLLRLYGNKDCTAMADEALRKESKP